MSRPSLLVLAASAAAIAVGCAHCDTCDDFPAPCTGPNCGYPYQGAFPIDGGANVVGPMMEGPIVGAPIVSSPTTMPSITPPEPTPSGSSSTPPPGPSPAPSGNGGAPSSSPSGGLDIPLPQSDSPFGNPSTR